MLYRFVISNVTAVKLVFRSDREAIYHAWNLSMDHKGAGVYLRRFVPGKVQDMGMIRAALEYVGRQGPAHSVDTMLRGTCGECGKRVCLTDNGKVYRHGHQGGEQEAHSKTRCPGSHEYAVGHGYVADLEREQKEESGGNS